MQQDPFENEDDINEVAEEDVVEVVYIQLHFIQNPLPNLQTLRILRILQILQALQAVLQASRINRQQRPRETPAAPRDYTHMAYSLLTGFWNYLMPANNDQNSTNHIQSPNHANKGPN